MPAPRTPAILDFWAYPTRACICGERFLDSPPQTDAEVTIWNEAGELVTTVATGSATASLHLAGLALVAGALYRAQLRYQNAVAWSGPSANVHARVPRDLDYEPIHVPDEPVVSAAVCPITPRRPAAQAYEMRTRRWQTPTGHIISHARDSDQRQSTTLTWPGLSTADRDTLAAYLKARLRAAEAFVTEDAVHGSTVWLGRRGTLEIVQTSAGVHAIRLEADQVIHDRAFTCGVSTFGGPDKFRTHTPG